MSIRAFFALPLQTPAIKMLADYADGLCAYDRSVEINWVDSSTYHLTLCFLGTIRLDQVDLLESITREHLAEHRSFQVEIEKTDYYPVNRELSLVAALPHWKEQLVALHRIMHGVAESAGIQTLESDFKPHITLGRLSGRSAEFTPPESWPPLELTSLADSVVLLQSRPGERGSIYTPLFEVPLLDMY